MDPELTAITPRTDALSSGDLHRAAETYELALGEYAGALKNEQGRPVDEQVELRIRMAECHHALGRYLQAREVLVSALELPIHELARARVEARVGWEEFHLGNMATCIGHYRSSIATLGPSDQHAEVAQVLRWLGYALRATGRHVEAEESLRDALAAAKRAGELAQLGSCYEALGNLARQRGRYREAVAYHDQSLALSTERGHKFHIAKDLLNIGLAALYAGDWQRSLESLERAQKTFAEIALSRGLLLADLALSRLHQRRGEGSTGLELARRALERARRDSDARAEVLAYEGLADIALESGDIASATAQYDEGWKRALLIAPDGDLVYELAWRRARLALDEDRIEDAEHLAHRSLHLAEQSFDSREAAAALRILAHVHFRRGLFAESQRALEEALGNVRAIEAPYETAELHEAFADFVHPGGVVASAALTHLFEARRLFTQLGARAAERRVEEKVARFEEIILADGPTMATQEVEHPGLPSGMIARDQRMMELVAQATELGSTDATVLLQGKTGTGKEVLARLMHDRGGRRERPFVPVNCAAMPTQLLESELFGHRRGAFTGAEHDRVGLFESAGEGTLFLDEIDKAPPEFQTKLLRVIEDRRVRPIGGTKEVSIRARVLCATNRDLRELMEDGRFLPDLYYRLAAFCLVVPELRERPDDLWALVDHYLAVARVRFGARRYRLTNAARVALAKHDWPGNVRELKNVIEAAAFFKRKTGVIDRFDLPTEITPQNGESLPQRIESLERREIALALRRSGGVKALAAQMLGVSRKGLLDRLRRLGIGMDGSPD